MKLSVNQGDNHLTTIFWAILAACFADIFLAIVTVKTYRLIRDYNLDHGHSVVGSTLSGILLALFVVIFAVVFSFRAGRKIMEMAGVDVAQVQSYVTSSLFASPTSSSPTPQAESDNLFSVKVEHSYLGAPVSDTDYHFIDSVNGTPVGAAAKNLSFPDGAVLLLQSSAITNNSESGLFSQKKVTADYAAFQFDVPLCDENGAVVWNTTFYFQKVGAPTPDPASVNYAVEVTQPEKANATPVPSQTDSATPQPSQPSSQSPNNAKDSSSWGVDSTTSEITGPLSKTAYWVPNGKSYHFRLSCPSLSRSDVVYSGTLQDALDAGKTDPCNNCAY